MPPYTEDCLLAFLLCPSPLGKRWEDNFSDDTCPLSALEAGRDGGEARTAKREGARGYYLMFPLGSRAGQSPRGPLHARGAGQPALRHKSSSSFLPAGSASFPRPGGAGAPGAGQAPLLQRRRRGGEGRRNRGREEKRPSRGRETRCAFLPSLLPAPPRGHTAAGEKPLFPRRRLPDRPAAVREAGPPPLNGHTAAGEGSRASRRSSRPPPGNRRPARPRRPTGSNSVALTGLGPGRCRGLPPSAAAPPPPSPGRSPVSPSFAGGGSLGPWPRAGQGRAGSSRRLWRALALRRACLRGGQRPGRPGPPEASAGAGA